MQDIEVGVVVVSLKASPTLIWNCVRARNAGYIDVTVRYYVETGHRVIFGYIPKLPDTTLITEFYVKAL